MNLTIKNECEVFSYPDRKEIETAVKLCCGRCCDACESPVEFAWRKRRIDLAYLVGLAVENELTPRERQVIRSVYYEGKSNAQTAEKYRLSRETVRSARKRAEEKLRHALKYVKYYIDDRIPLTDSSLLPGDVLSVIRARETRAANLGGKLFRLRSAKAFPVKLISDITGISVSRLRKFESGGALPDALEIGELCAAYGVTPNEIFDYDNERKENELKS